MTTRGPSPIGGGTTTSGRREHVRLTNEGHHYDAHRIAEHI